MQYLHAHKEMFAAFVKEITEPSTDKPRMQPSTFEMKGAFLRFPGRVVTLNAFEKYAPRRLRTIQNNSSTRQYTHWTPFFTRNWRPRNYRLAASPLAYRVRSTDFRAKERLLARSLPLGLPLNSVRIPRRAQKLSVFIKKPAAEIDLIFC